MKFKTVIFGTIFLFSVLTSFAHTQEIKLGSFKISSTSSQILGEDFASDFEKILKKDESITWQIYVPKNYDPTIPTGILLFQNHGGSISEPIGWKSAMDEKNLILVRIYVAGRLIERKEMFLGILSLPLLQKEYNIDTKRVYSTAHNECNVIGATARVYPNIIKGAIYVNCIPTTWRKQKPERIDLMRENRYVFIHGKNSGLKSDIKRKLRRYNDNGILNTKYSIASKMGPANNISRTELLKAIDFLDN